MGKIYEQKLKFDDAANYYKQSANLLPQDKEIWLRLGMSQLGANLLNDALISFEKADKVCPFNTDVFTGWGMALMKLKNTLWLEINLLQLQKSANIILLQFYFPQLWK